MSKIIFAGGGTGGHLFPAIALAEEYKNRKKEAEVVFVGTKKGLENKLIPEKGYRLELISIKGFPRGLSSEVFLFPWFLLRSLIEAGKILKKEKPGLVIGTGGYVSFPVVLMSRLRGIPTLIQEQNSYPGISTRFLSFFANTVCLTYESSKKFFLQKKKLKVLGNPVRKEIALGNRNFALKSFNLEENKKTVFVLGGSQGSHNINKAVKGCLEVWEKRKDIQILWHTGEKEFEEMKNYAQSKKLKVAVLPFIKEMNSAYAVADLIISRAGALTLAEISLCGKPAILVPYPFATADHQRFNALEFEKKEAAVIILDYELTGEKLTETVFKVLDDQKKLEEMGKNSKSLSKPEATFQIVEEMEKLLEGEK
jgi:UDP-N-acetylglucosamine--N-acetylmuramyl-(pentapeptide) pyrophosphoryl-undecaprenol N-acetylglucosamine transferase